MSKRGAGTIDDLLNAGEKAGEKPYHPDASRWTLAILNFFVCLLGLTGEHMVAFIERSSESFQRSMLDHGASIYRLADYLWYASFALLSMIACMTCIGIPARMWWWRRSMRTFRGKYMVVVMPRPEGTTGTSMNTNPDAPFVFWDRLLTIVQHANNKRSNAYLSVELWGNSSGRVRWGMYLPKMMEAERDAVRRLITADRPQARLVEVNDPLDEALRLDPDDPRDTGIRFYASAILNLGARDYYPLPTDGLTLPTLVSTLRPRTDVMASGVSIIATPELYLWAARVNQLVQRWSWMSRYRRKFDERWKAETDAISIKAQQAHARVCVRVQVIAKTREAAIAERDAVVTALGSSEKRYSFVRQSLTVHRRYCLHLQAPAADRQEPGRAAKALDRIGLRLGRETVSQPVQHEIPLDFRVRAPFRPDVRALFPIPFFPFC